MAKHDYTALLEKEAGTAPQPSPVPDGTYKGQIQGAPKVVDRQTKNGTKGILQIIVALTDPGDDVDEDELTEAGGIRYEDGRSKTVRAEFWLEEDSMWKVDAFLASFGFTAGGGTSYIDAFKTLPDRTVTVAVIRDTFESNGVERTNNKVTSIHADE